MSEATVTPIATAGSFRCEEHDESFTTPQGLGAHRRHHHKPTSTSSTSSASPLPRKKAAKREPKPRTPAIVEVSDRQALTVLASAYADLCGADVETAIDSAAALLDAISGRGWRLVES